MRSFKGNENIHKKEGGSYYVVSANKASSVTLQSPGNESQRKHTQTARVKDASNTPRDFTTVFERPIVLGGNQRCVIGFDKVNTTT